MKRKRAYHKISEAQACWIIYHFDKGFVLDAFWPQRGPCPAFFSHCGRRFSNFKAVRELANELKGDKTRMISFIHMSHDTNHPLIAKTEHRAIKGVKKIYPKGVVEYD